jgi:hypothetical protein
MFIFKRLIRFGINKKCISTFLHQWLTQKMFGRTGRTKQTCVTTTTNSQTKSSFHAFHFLVFSFSFFFLLSLYKILETHQPNRSSSPVRYSSLPIFNILSIFLFHFTPISLSLSLLPLYFSHSYFLRSTFLLPLFLCHPLSF